MEYHLKVNGETVYCLASQLENASPSLARKVRIASLAGRVLDVKVEAEAVDGIVHFIKTRIFQPDFENLSNLTYEAHRLEIPALLIRCEEEYLGQLVQANCLESLLFAEGNGCEKLEEKAFSMAMSHFDEISNMEQFLYIGKSHLMKLVLNVNFSLCSRQSVYYAIMRWRSYEPCIRSTDAVDIAETFVKRVSLPPWLEGNISRKPQLFHQSNHLRKTEKSCKPTVVPAKKAKPVNIVCIGHSSSEEMSVIYLTLVNGKLTVSTIPIPRSENLGRDSAFCHTEDSIYACGGDAKPDRTRRFDIQTQTWNKCPGIFNGRKNHMVCMVNKRMYVLGGVNTNTGKVFEYVDKYNLSTKRWVYAGKLDGFVRSAVCAAYGEDIYVFGGLNSQNESYQTIQCYNTATKKTTNVCKLPTKSHICQTVTDRNMIYLIAAEGQVMQFDPMTEELNNLPSRPNPGRECGAFIENGFLYVFGGKTGSKRHQRFVSDIYRLDTRNLVSNWQFVSSLPETISVITCSKTFLDVK